MVLYKGESMASPKAKALPKSLDFPVWIIEETGEWFTDYNTYSWRMSFYKSAEFASELTDRSNMSYLDAMLDETQALNNILNNMSNELQIPLCKYLLNLSNKLKSDQLISKCQDLLKQGYFINETVKFHNELTKPIEDRYVHPESNDTAQLKSDVDFKNYIGVEFVIKEKTTFDAIKDDYSGEILVPPYTRYLLHVKNKSDSDGEAKVEKFIADGTQIQRVKQIPNRDVLKSFIKLVFCPINNHAMTRLKNQNAPLYLELKKWHDNNKENGIPLRESTIISSSENDKSTTNEQIKESNKRSLEHESEAENSMDSFKRFQREDPVDENSTELLNHLDQTPSENLPHQEDLDIPFQGFMDTFQGFCYFNDELDSLPLDDVTKRYILNKNIPIFKLLEVYQFVLTFNKVLRINMFNIDDLIASIKCTDPYGLSGEIVNIELKHQQENMANNHDSPEVNVEGSSSNKFIKKESLLQRNPKIRKLIKDKDNDIITYRILSNVPASDQQLEIAVNNGMHLFISVVISMLSLIINGNGDWRCDIVEEWFENNHVDEDALSMDSTLENILNYKNVNWAERLTKREFHYGYWLIILLGVLQDSMHISKYTKIVLNFTKKIVPDSNSGNAPKSMFLNFCRRLTILEKVDILWVLMDIVANYSDDIKKWVNGTPKLAHEIKIEKSRLTRLKFAESTVLAQLTHDLESVKKNPTSEKSLIENLQLGIEKVRQNIGKLTKEEHYLTLKSNEYDDQDSLNLGMDRFGNRFYWIHKLDIESPDNVAQGLTETDNLYYCGRLCVRGPIPDMVKFLLDITPYQYDRWHDIAQVEGKATATKEVFGVYRDKLGSYYQCEDDIDIKIVSENGQLVGDYKLSNIQKKIVNETPSNLLLDPNECYFIENASAVRNFLYKLNTWGERESELYSNIFKALPEILKSFESKHRHIGDEVFDVMEERLLTELKKYDCSDAELRELALKNEKEQQVNPSDINIKANEKLLTLADSVVSLYDTKMTRRILHRITKLESLRSLILEEQMNLLNIKSLGIRTMDFLEKAEITAIANKKLRKQMDILTDLLNYRHFRAIKNLSKWKGLPGLRRAANSQNQQESLDVDKLLKKIFEEIETRITPNDWEGSTIEQYYPLDEKTTETPSNPEQQLSTIQQSNSVHQTITVQQIQPPLQENVPSTGTRLVEERPIEQTNSPATVQAADQEKMPTNIGSQNAPIQLL